VNGILEEFKNCPDISFYGENYLKSIVGRT